MLGESSHSVKSEGFRVLTVCQVVLEDGVVGVKNCSCAV